MRGHFSYRDGRLHAEDVPLEALAAAHGTPLYVYTESEIRARVRAYRQALDSLGVGIFYAVKANSNQAILRIMAEEGAGADVVSGGELMRARAAGIAPEHIVFSGVGKSVAEIDLALGEAIHQINIESVEELHLVAARAQALGRSAPVALRVNPDVAAPTHAKIATGRAHDKFGIAFDRAVEVFRLAAGLPGIEVMGPAMHIGSQILDLAPFQTAYARLATLCTELAQAGLPPRRIDIGGGLGIGYQGQPEPDLAGYADLVRRHFAMLGCDIAIEPGRSLVGPAGVLLTRLLYLKHEGGRLYAVTDAAMNDLIRPSLYDAWHDVVPVSTEAGRDQVAVDLVGPVCESGDTFARDRPIPRPEAGELLAFLDAGAYGFVMASRYNTRPMAAEVLVRGKDVAVIRPRESVDAIIAAEPTPAWLA